MLLLNSERSAIKSAIRDMLIREGREYALEFLEEYGETGEVKDVVNDRMSGNVIDDIAERVVDSIEADIEKESEVGVSDEVCDLIDMIEAA